MRLKLIVLSFLALGIAACPLPPVHGQGEKPKAQVLPTHGIWKLEMDDKVDGQIDPKASVHHMKVSVINNRLIGRNAEPVWEKKAQWSGEIAEGKTPIIFIRQDNTERKGETVFFSGRLVRSGVIVGTFFNNQGESGDFRLTLEKTD